VIRVTFSQSQHGENLGKISPDFLPCGVTPKYPLRGPVLAYKGRLAPD